jgi:hypothetical protein
MVVVVCHRKTTSGTSRTDTARNRPFRAGPLQGRAQGAAARLDVAEATSKMMDHAPDTSKAWTRPGVDMSDWRCSGIQ